MTKNAITWIREDFRIEHNPALAYATQNHENVIALYIYNKADFDNKREAQKWWLSKSLEVFKSELQKYKINLQILEGDELDILSKLKKKDDISIYWNKIYEPDVIAKGKKIRDIFIKNQIEFKYFKGNILNEFQEVTKNDGTPFKVFTPFWRNAEQKFLGLPPSKNYIVKKKTKTISLFKNSVEPKKILPKKNWYKKFEKYWNISENDSKKILNNLIENKIKNYGTSRDIPSVEGTSKLSPYIKFGQIHVGTIWKKCSEIKSKGIGYRKYVKRAQLLWTYKETMDKLSSMKESYIDAVKKIKEYDNTNPEFSNDYKEKYMKARRDAGIPDEENSFVQFLALDIDTEWDSFLKPDTSKEAQPLEEDILVKNN